MNKLVVNQYIQILKEELVPALGCTEPIAIAYAAAKARKILGNVATQIDVFCSGNMIKNARCVSVPNTHKLSGIEASAVIGMVGGDDLVGLQVLAKIQEEHIQQAQKYLKQGICHVHHLKSDASLHIIMEMKDDRNKVKVEIKETHTNIVKITKNDEIVYECKKEGEDYQSNLINRDVLNVDDIYHFAKEVPLKEVEDVLNQQIACNMAIAEEGLKGQYGIGIGQVLLESMKDFSVYTKCKAYAAAASEARMGGCSMPVITNSGSGNQGMTASIPVIVYARDKGVSEEELLRALLFSNLITIHQKTGIGRLSAFCGAVSAACASGAALTFLEDGTLKQIEMCIINTLANTPGIVCDGAKVSCAAKIATGLDAAFMSHLLAMKNRCYKCQEGILKSNIEETISAVARIGRYGMKTCDEEILDIILDKKMNSKE